MGGSSSHRRRNSHHSRSLSNNRFIPSQVNHHNNNTHPRSPAVPVPALSSSLPTARTLTFDQLTINEGPGFDLLCKSGWVPGQTLGPNSQSCSASCDNVHNKFTSFPSVSTSSVPEYSSSSSLLNPLPIVVRQGRHGVGAANSACNTPNQSQSANIAHSAPPTPRARGRTCKSQKSCSNRSRKHQGHSHPRFSQRRNNNNLNNGNSTPIHSMSSSMTSIEPASPTLVTQLANLEIFDPLRPRCQYDPSHIVRDLKALRKHELTCPANPNREASASLRRLPSSPFSPPSTSVLQSGIGPNHLSFSSSSFGSIEDEVLSDAFSTSSVESDVESNEDGNNDNQDDDGDDSEVSSYISDDEGEKDDNPMQPHI